MKKEICANCGWSLMDLPIRDYRNYVCTEPGNTEYVSGPSISDEKTTIACTTVNGRGQCKNWKLLPWYAKLFRF